MTVASEPLRVGIVGLGEALAGPSRSGIADMVAAGQVRVVAASDPGREARASAAAAFGLDGPLPAGDSVVASHLDVVLLFGRGDDRPRLAIDALGRGLDVIVDGPVASTVSAAGRVVDAARTSGRRLLCGPFLLDDTFRRVSDLVAEGAIGTILSARAVAAAPRGAGTAADRRPVTAAAPRSGISGEQVFDACGPAVAALVRLAGPVQGVTAVGRAAAPKTSAAGHRAGTSSWATPQIGLDFGAGVLGVLTVVPPGSALRTPSLEVFGSDGTIQIDGRLGRDGGFDLWLNAVGAWELVPGDGVPGDSVAAALRSICDGTVSAPPTRDDPMVATDVLEVSLLAAAAAADGRARATAAIERRSSAAEDPR